MDQYRLRERRLALGLTQCQVAARIGDYQAAVSQAELGRASPRIVRSIVRCFICELVSRRDARIARERAARNAELLDAIPPSREREAFRAALLDRVAEYIFHEAEPEKADVLLEFVSRADAESLLDHLFAD